tara:strand:+ start:196 stop:390 length:195 start_codon:yes stop_codon:yes gene_type:complete
MLSKNLSVKGYANEEFGAEPAITLTITSMITMEELQAILSPLREAFNNLGESMSFDISFRDLDI